MKNLHAQDYVYELRRVEFLDDLTIARALCLCPRCMQPLSKVVSDDEYDRDSLCENCAKASSQFKISQ